MEEGTNNRPILAFTNGNGEAKKIDINRALEEYPSADNSAIELGFDEDRDSKDFLFACS